MATVAPDSVLDGLPRRLRSADSVLLALAGGLGTGVFIVFAPAARAAGTWLLLAVALAGLASLCTAMSAAELRRRQPGQELLVPSAGRLGDVAFLSGRTAAAAAAGGVFATHVLPSDLLWAAIPMITIGGALTMAGVNVTTRGARVLVIALLSVLAVVVVVGLTGHAEAADIPTEPPSGMPASGAGQLGILTAAGLLFFAFAGFPRMDALAVHSERAGRRGGRTLLVAFVVMVLVYLAVGAALLHSLGAARLADTLAPLAVATSTDAAPALGALVRIAAAAATVAAMLTVLASVGGAASGMADRGDLPAWLVRTNRRARPWRVDLLATLGAVLISILAGPVGAVGLAACCLLVHSAEVNRAALRPHVRNRTSRPWIALVGLPVCLVLAGLLPLTQVLVSAAILVLGVLLTYRVSRSAPVRASG